MPYSISNLKYSGISVDTQSDFPTDIKFKPDGTVMYELGDDGRIYSYALSSPWNISTAVYVDTVDIDNGVSCIFFSPDGTRLYYIRRWDVSASIIEKIMSTPWDLSSLYASSEIDAIAYEANSLMFQPNVINDQYLVEFNPLYSTTRNSQILSTPYVLESAYPFDLYGNLGYGENIVSITISEDGYKLYSIGDKIREFNLEMSWAVINPMTEVASIDTQGTLSGYSTSAIVWNSGGTKLYEINSVTKKIYQYDTDTTYLPEMTYNLSYAGTRLMFCDGSMASNGDGWTGQSTITIGEGQESVDFPVTVGPVYGILMVSIEGIDSHIIEVIGCEENYPDIPEYKPEWYMAPIWNTWPDYDPDITDLTSFKWCECDIYGGVVEYGECMTKPVDVQQSHCCDYVPKDFRQWSKNFEYNHKGVY